MIIGLLLLGSVAGAIAGTTALAAGQTLLTVFLVYAGAGILSILAVIAVCAVRTHLARRSTLPHRPTATLPER